MGLQHLVPQLFQFHHCRSSRCPPCPSSISVSDCVSSSTASSGVQTYWCCRVISCTSARNGMHDTAPDNFQIDPPSKCVVPRSAGSEAPTIFVILTLPSCVSFCRIIPAPRRTAISLIQQMRKFALQARFDQMVCFLLMSTPTSLRIGNAPSPADLPFTRAFKSDSPELKKMTACVVQMERSMWEP